jgi:hypothetical protein
MGVGFTTSESERVVANPTRRRIISLLMLMGNAGITSAIATLVLTFVNRSGPDMAIRVAIIAAGLAVLAALARSRMVDRLLTRMVRAALQRWTDLAIHDYEQLLEIGQGYGVVEIAVDPDDWLCGKKLRDLRLSQEGVLVLGVRRPDGAYVGVASGDLEITAGCVLACYGRSELLKKLAARSRGEQGAAQHLAAVQEMADLRRQQEEMQKQATNDQ